ncbi:hypothetical protein [Aestuariispira insulae]|uniref:Uncharacterized protein n=1 Tax=Aestuariispira insulae TaxID=1461337 RepID=A0A3D9HWX9_9PROT|nr:hypothetical protein [Aestuariispira insulae]RED53891.1 hypothetical protein DFP90_101690 [Aestuariispira insulae]
MPHTYREIGALIHESPFFDHLQHLHGMLLNDVKIAAMVLHNRDHEERSTDPVEVIQRFDLDNIEYEEAVLRLEMSGYINQTGDGSVIPGPRLSDQKDPLAEFLKNFDITN